MFCFTPSGISLAFMIDQIVEMLIHKMLMIIIWDMAKLLSADKLYGLLMSGLLDPFSYASLRNFNKNANNIFNLFVVLFHCLGSSFVLILTYL